MASMRKCLSAGASTAVRLYKSSSRSSSSCRAPVASGSIGGHCTVSQTCSPKVTNSALFGSSCSPSRVSTPFCTKCNIPGSIPGGRRFALRIARLPGELGAAQSLLPYYSAIADSRLVSRLSTSGDAPILQGTLNHMSPDL